MQDVVTAPRPPRCYLERFVDLGKELCGMGIKQGGGMRLASVG